MHYASSWLFLILQSIANLLAFKMFELGNSYTTLFNQILINSVEAFYPIKIRPSQLSKPKQAIRIVINKDYILFHRLVPIYN